MALQPKAKRAFLVASVALLLAGCVSDNDAARIAEREARAGHCDPAVAYADQHISDSGLRYYEHAYVDSHCLRNRAEMFGYLNLSARYGNMGAQKVLMKLGKPVPAADLRIAEEQASEARAATLLMLLGAVASGYNQAHYHASVPVSTSCTTGSTGIVNCLSY